MNKWTKTTLPLMLYQKWTRRLKVSFIRRAAFSSNAAINLPQPLTLNEERISNCPHSSQLEEQLQEQIAQKLLSHYAAQTPVILRSAVSHQKAITSWSDLQYLEDTVGFDIPCEVEIGSSYGSHEGVINSTIAFGDYINYIRLFQEQQQKQKQQFDPKQEPPKEFVYMAQHQLFPSLRKDITLPSLSSSTKYGIGHGKLYSSLIWFGPSGCKSTLHYDPCDNLLMQFVGRKKVMLYPPQPREKRGMGVPTPCRIHQVEMKKYEEETCQNNNEGDIDETPKDDWYYAGQGSSLGGQQYNTSAVDVENPDLIKNPLFAHAPPARIGILNPGDVLFIPIQWWHFVRSLDTSVSVNVWWR